MKKMKENILELLNFFARFFSHKFWHKNIYLKIGFFDWIDLFVNFP